MRATAKTQQAAAVRKRKAIGNMPVPKGRASGTEKERVLIEFPRILLQRTDEAARQLDKNRSDLIRTAVERLLNEMESSIFERELADAYAANAAMNLQLAEGFAVIDREGF